MYHYFIFPHVLRVNYAILFKMIFSLYQNLHSTKLLSFLFFCQELNLGSCALNTCSTTVSFDVEITRTWQWKLCRPTSILAYEVHHIMTNSFTREILRWIFLKDVKIWLIWYSDGTAITPSPFSIVSPSLAGQSRQVQWPDLCHKVTLWNMCLFARIPITGTPLEKLTSLMK
jgi:hypothetical protein